MRKEVLILKLTDREGSKTIKPADLGGNRKKLWKESGTLKWGSQPKSDMEEI
jgi:hypothetical protein